MMSKRSKIFGGVLAAILAGVAIVLSCFRIAAARRETRMASDVAPRSGQFVRTSGGVMYVQTVGPTTGPPVLLVHGTGAWSEIWRQTLDTLAHSGFRAIAVDMPPFGFSDRPLDANYTDDAQARRILGVINTLGLDSVTLVGHSFGARPTMTAFFLDPSHVSRLVLVDAALGLDTPATAPTAAWPVRAALGISPLRSALVSATLTNPSFTARLLRGLVLDTSAITPARVTMLQRPFVREGTTVSYGEWLQPFVTTAEHSLATQRSRYASIRIPTLIIWGDRDAITPIAQGRDLAQLIPGAALAELNDVGHIPAIEAPSTFNAALLSFLTKH